jgi:hypothetical protein
VCVESLISVEAADTGKPGVCPGHFDVALSELSEPIRSALQAAPLPFLGSHGFCTIYDDPPATRVVMEIDEGGVVRQAAFYRERRFLGLLGVIDFVGFPAISDSEILELLALHGLHVAVVNRLRAPAAPRGGGVEIDFQHDVIAELPATKEAYLQSLGKQKRQQLPRYWRRLGREHPDIQFRIQCGADIDLDDILQLVSFNQSRMERQGKNNATEIESAKQRRRRPLTQAQGLICKMVAGGRLLGGTFNYIHRDEAFLIVIAHDPALEHLNIGHVALWKTFEHLIDRGIKRYHLFWGRKRYKTEFGGVDHAVIVSLIARRRWLARMWKLHWLLRHRIPQAWRLLGSIPRRLVQSRSARDPDRSGE